MPGRAVTRPDTKPSGPTMPAFEHLVPPVSLDELVSAIETWTKPGDVVLDLNGRGGWVARAAVCEQRRVADLEEGPLTRLLAEAVLRPPDMRQIDGAVAMLAAASSSGSSVRRTIDALYASTCATCGRPVTLEAIVWAPMSGPHHRAAAKRPKAEAALDPEADTADAEFAGVVPEDLPAVTFVQGETLRALSREYRCARCHEQLGGAELRRAAPVRGDVDLAASLPSSGPVREAMRRRFPAPRPTHPLVDQLIDIHTPRQLLGLNAILSTLENDTNRFETGVMASLRLALLHAALVSGRLNTGRGGIAGPSISNGALKLPAARHWREKNPWSAFEDGVKAVKTFINEIDAARPKGAAARIGTDLAALEVGTSNVVLLEATPGSIRRLGLHGERTTHSGIPSRTKLMLGQAPQPMNQQRLAASYYYTAWVYGAAAVLLLPWEELFKPAEEPEPLQAAADFARSLGRSLAVASPALSGSGRAIVLLDDDEPATLVAAALGGAAAGCRLVDARVRRGEGAGGVAAFIPSTGVLDPAARDRANRRLPPLPGGAGDPAIVTTRRIFSGPEKVDDGPFQPAVATQAIGETTVNLLKARGEPATMEQMLGDLLIALDRTGQLARLARVLRPPRADQGWDAWVDPEPEAAPATANATAGATAGAGSNPVGELLELVRTELERPANRRIRQVEPGQFWLGTNDDINAASPPLSDRVEWAVFSLLSSAGHMTRRAAVDRIAGMFRGGDTPDRDLVEACIDSYEAPGAAPGEIVSSERLETRAIEHDAVIARLADLGHRMGMKVWIGSKQQARKVGGYPLSARLDLDEKQVHLPVIAWAPEGELERVDCAWYIRRKATFLFEVEWTAMMHEPLIRHARYPVDEKIVRFLVLPPQRAELAAIKLARSALLRQSISDRNWHFLKWNHLAEFAATSEPSLDRLEPYVGLEALADKGGEQLGLFGI